MASQLYQCRVCGIDYASRGREWRNKKKCVWFPKQPPKHLPKRLWQAPAGQLLCGQCRSPTTCQVTGNASGPEKTIAKQKFKLRKGSNKLAREKRKVKEAKQKIKKLKDVSARKPKATGDFAAFCKEKKVSANELRLFRKVRHWLFKRRKAGAGIRDVVEPLLDCLNNDRLPHEHIFYEYIRRAAVNLNRKSLADARWGKRIMDLIAAAQCVRGGKPVLASLRGMAGAGEGRSAPLATILNKINLPTPDESSVRRHIIKNSVDPKFRYGVSELKMLHAVRELCGGQVPSSWKTVIQLSASSSCGRTRGLLSVPSALTISRRSLAPLLCTANTSRSLWRSQVGCATLSTARSCAAQPRSSSASRSHRLARPSMRRARILPKKMQPMHA